MEYSERPLVDAVSPPASTPRRSARRHLLRALRRAVAGSRELWESDPFSPEIRDGWLYARGVADDKGQLWALLRAALDLAGEGRLPVNVRFCCDGEEEIGGTSIVEFLDQHAGEADACVIFDAAMLDHGHAGLLHLAPAARSISTSKCERASATCTRACSVARR